MLDILIRNATIVDGTGRPGYPGDIAIVGDRVVDIGVLESAQAESVIDATGLVATPGFVDIHSHADYDLALLPTADSQVHQGVTTVVVGQCGCTPTPLLPGTRQTVLDFEWEGYDMPWERLTTFGSHLSYLREIGVSVNAVSLVGQGTIRAGVMGYRASAATLQEITRMQAEASKAMDEGAIGISTGLLYIPGAYASTEEVIDVTRPAGARRGYYFSHSREEGGALLSSIAETVRIGRETGASIQYSHFKAIGRRNWHLASEGLALIDRAHDEGLDITPDMYPYTAGSMGLSAMLPAWAQEGGKEAVLQRLADKGTRARMTEGMKTAGPATIVGWDEVLINGSPTNPSYEGRYVAELASDAGKDPFDWVFDALLEARLTISMVEFFISEENVRMELRYPHMMIGSDSEVGALEGPRATGKPHPRTFGTFPRVLGRYVREEHLLTLEQAIHKMTGLPATKLRWSDRGLLKKGYYADLVLLDPATVADRGTYEDPRHRPEGIHLVMVNGKPVVQDARHSGARPGMVLGMAGSPVY